MDNGQLYRMAIGKGECGLGVAIREICYAAVW